MEERNGLTWSSSSFSRTPALVAASNMLSSKMSQPVKTRSSRPASGTNSLILGERPSVRLPRRTVPICVSEPMGFEIPLRTASTPATKVVATAPIPGIMTPSFPLAGCRSLGAFFGVLDSFTSTRACGFADFGLFAIFRMLPYEAEIDWANGYVLVSRGAWQYEGLEWLRRRADARI